MNARCYEPGGSLNASAAHRQACRQHEQHIRAEAAWYFNLNSLE